MGLFIKYTCYLRYVSTKLSIIHSYIDLGTEPDLPLCVMGMHDCESTCSVVFTEVMIYFFPKEPVAELRVPMFQLSLTGDDLDTDSAMGVSIFMDDRSMCTFATEEEVSEFVCVHYTFLPRMR